MIIMGGRYGDCDSSYWGETEWNIVCDTLAASIVFSRDIPNCFVIGVEQTSTYSEDPYYIKTAFKSIAGLEPVYQSINTLAKRIWFHDPLALYAFFNQSEVELTRGNISVSPFSEKLPAATYFKKADDGRHFLITSYSPDKFFADFAKHTKLKL